MNRRALFKNLLGAAIALPMAQNIHPAVRPFNASERARLMDWVIKRKVSDLLEARSKANPLFSGGLAEWSGAHQLPHD